jgi:hypothetical protein
LKIVSLLAEKYSGFSFMVFGVEPNEYKQNFNKNVAWGNMQNCITEMIDAKLILARSGRNLLSEILYLNKHAIIFPSYNSINNIDEYRFSEQIKNAREAKYISPNVRIWENFNNTLTFKMFEDIVTQKRVRISWIPGNDFLFKLLK